MTHTLMSNRINRHSQTDLTTVSNDAFPFRTSNVADSWHQGVASDDSTRSRQLYSTRIQYVHAVLAVHICIHICMYVHACIHNKPS